MSNADRLKMLDKATKLLALANDPTAPQGERDAAKAALARIMAQHNIDISEAVHQPEYAVTEDKDTDADDSHDLVLAQQVAKFNGVFILLNTVRSYSGTTKSLQVVGARGDIEAYLYMKDVLYRQRTSAYMAAMEAGKERHNDKARREFYTGFGLGVKRLVADLMAQRDQVIHSRALVPVRPEKQAESWYKATHNANLRSSALKTGNYSQNGYEAGRSASLNKGVTQATTAPALRLGM